MTDRNAESVALHPFFRAMVLMGGSVALSCGGATSENHGGAGSSGTGGTGGSGGTGGAPSGGTGGMIVGTGGVMIGTGGIAGAAGRYAQDAGPFPCAPALWDCGTNAPNCAYSLEGYVLPSGCACDSTRPLHATDCPAGQVRVCRKGVADASGARFATPIPFGCTCEPKTNCATECATAFVAPGGYYSCVEPTTGLDVLCGCAVIVLK